jgi:hypothetical protein
MERTLWIISAVSLAVLGCAQAGAQQLSGHVSEVERQALMELFAATGGERWTKRDGWGTSAPVCKWHGVFCDFVAGNPSRPNAAFGRDLQPAGAS